jgi:hypothetical protein
MGGQYSNGILPGQMSLAKRNPGSQRGWINQGGEANKKSGNAAFFAFPE